MKTKNRILVPLDGSLQSMDAAQYAAHVMPPDGTEVHLFCVEQKFPDLFNDLDVSTDDTGLLDDWMEKRRTYLDKFTERAFEYFQQNGFSKDAVEVTFQPVKSGIARDILAESRNGYQGVVVGRTGIGSLPEIHMGSVATKLMDAVTHVPIIIVGGAPETKKVLIGFDDSRGAHKSVDAVADLLAGSDCHINLCHVIRSMKILQGGFDEIYNGPDEMEEEKWRKMNSDKIIPAMEAAKNKLISKGFPKEKVTGSVIVDVVSRARTIVEEAEKREFGSIVVGRRGISMVREFFMGRVAKKIVQMTNRSALWIAG